LRLRTSDGRERRFVEPIGTTGWSAEECVERKPSAIIAYWGVLGTIAWNASLGAAQLTSVADLWLWHGLGYGRDTYWVENNGLDLACR
jgi:hypothetical protein